MHLLTERAVGNSREKWGTVRLVFGKIRCLAGAIFLFCAILGAHAGESFIPALEEGKFFGFAKAMYLGDDKKGGRRNQSTPGFGGKLGAETGEYAGFKLKGAWYTTTDLGLRQDDPQKTDAYMFDLNKKPYSLLGEMQISARQGNTLLTIGRQEFFSPIINTYDYRIIPNLFDAYTLTNRDIPDTTFTLAYVIKMSGLDGLVTFSEFRSMSQQAYTSLKVASDGAIDAKNGDTLDISKVVGNQGVWTTGIVHGKDNKFQMWNYYGADTLNTLYIDGYLKSGLNQDFTAILEGQTYQVNRPGFSRHSVAG